MNDTSPEEQNKEESPTEIAVGLECPICKSIKSKVVDKRNYQSYIRRRRQCENKHRYSTIELEENKPGIRMKGSIAPNREEFITALKDSLIQSIDYTKLANAIYTATAQK